MINYTLAFACSQDGFIARHSGDDPFEWTSKDDQNHLQNLIKDNDWQVMCRITHELNPIKTRKRIIFSLGTDEIKLINSNIKNQYYFNPDLHQWEDFERLCKDSVLILGGTKVHDFFLYSNLIDSMYITVEPLNFKEGVPAFSYINFSDIIPFFKEQGFSSQEEIINDKGTKLIKFKKF